MEKKSETLNNARARRISACSSNQTSIYSDSIYYCIHFLSFKFCLNRDMFGGPIAFPFYHVCETLGLRNCLGTPLR